MEHTDLKQQKLTNIRKKLGIYKTVKHQDIEFIDLALTSRCNINCALCQKTLVHKGKIPIVDLDIDLIKTKIFTKEQTEKYKKVICCGSFGDPMMYKHIDEFIEHMVAVGPHLFLQFNTNGSMRSIEWWENLGKKFKDLNYWVQFGIDGSSEDTYKKYRVGGKFNKVMENMFSYVVNGGKAIWQFIIFDYNEHQVESTQKFCESLGIRFQPIMSYKYNEGFGRPKGWEIGYELGSINCRTHVEKSVYIDENGWLTPCCFSNPTNKLYYNERQKMLVGKGLDLNQSTIEDAINSDFFQYTTQNQSDIQMCKFFCANQKRFEVRKK